MHQCLLHCYFQNSGFIVSHLLKDKNPQSGGHYNVYSFNHPEPMASLYPFLIPLSIQNPQALAEFSWTLHPRFHLGKVPMDRICRQAAWCNEEIGFGYYQLSGLGHVLKSLLMFVMQGYTQPEGFRVSLGNNVYKMPDTQESMVALI